MLAQMWFPSIIPAPGSSLLVPTCHSEKLRPSGALAKPLPSPWGEMKLRRQAKSRDLEFPEGVV